MSTCQNCEKISCTQDSVKGQETLNRRDFTRKALAAGFLSSLSLLTIPQTARAWMDGKFHEREDLGDAFKVLVKTYSDNNGYPHKFNDALVKLLLRDLDFAVKTGVYEEFAQHYVMTLGALINKYIKKGVQKYGKDIFLWGIFERTTCSYQLYEKINIGDQVRTIPCPFKSTLDRIHNDMGGYSITWDDVHYKWCIPVWKGFAEIAEVKIKVEPGETCTIRVL